VARTRNIKPSFFKNEDLAKLSQLTRLLFIGLWTQADREGRLEGRPRRIKAELLPFDRYRIEDGLLALVAGGFIDRYRTVDGLSVIQVRKFSIHQSPHPREEASVLPKWDGSMADGGADSKETEVMHESSMTHASPKRKSSKRHASTMHESSIGSQSVVPAPLALTLNSDSNESIPPDPPSSNDDPLAAFYAPNGAPPEAPADIPLVDEPKKSATALGQVIDGVRAAGIDLTFNAGRDGKALKESGADPSDVVAVFVAIYYSKYGDDFMRRRLNIPSAIEAINGYKAWLASGGKVRPIGGRPVNAARSLENNPAQAKRMAEYAEAGRRNRQRDDDDINALIAGGMSEEDAIYQVMSTPRRRPA
jgi:hypothetical protein